MSHPTNVAEKSVAPSMNKAKMAPGDVCFMYSSASLGKVFFNASVICGNGCSQLYSLERGALLLTISVMPLWWSSMLSFSHRKLNAMTNAPQILYAIMTQGGMHRSMCPSIEYRGRVLPK
jgi:hypothetical protein